ncbi:MAG: thioredoxin domain-containing protein [Balneolaceae bacterium]|nr:thioredoxin domain-containing protein [Balneolaceae bacterium]MBO6547891.1 thioredoxin domain-containing protein [Balneolaceae bacterium]MBO6648404.1 thioredoxin domain-containing protein [Balneolaceae bacterium]
MPNRLAKEKSPYLLQHKDNPVEWLPWGDAAFTKAQKENKPVFLSIGYATCHWCHVMAHESFEDEQIASLLNDAFINVKVDREERPDIDSMYMTVCQMLNGHGGWPLTIVLTPDKEPFFAATYIPKEARYGRIGLRQLIPGIKGMWAHEPEKIRKAVESIKEGFGKSQQFEAGEFPGTETIDYAAEQLAMRFDDEFGGFGSAPKFPSPHNLMFLLRHWKQTGEQRFLDSVVETLIAMRLGGIWDHIGFGFHRYSTDKEWLLPHFEKMLYDQALLMMAYTEAWQITKNPLFKQTVFEIAEYVSRELTSEEGVFFSAEDADSEGEEGKFYIWDFSEIDSILDESDASFFKTQFNLKKEGNFEDEASKELTGQNIPHLSRKLSEEELEHWAQIRTELFDVRDQRIRPQLDDKSLTDWNALMIAALAKAGAVFNNPEFIKQAEKAFSFINQHLINEGQLFHRYKEGETAIEAFADDYAFLIWAGIELYEATFNSEYLGKAIEWNKQLLNIFWDEEHGGFFFSVNDSDQPLGRQKQIYDGAVPSSNSVAFLNLIRLGRFTGNSKLEEKANQLGQSFSSDLIRSGSSSAMSMMALQFLFNDPKEVVIAEGENDPTEFFKHFRADFDPFKVLLFKPRKKDKKLFEIASYLENQTAINKKTTLYICRNYSCEKPVFDINSL